VVAAAAVPVMAWPAAVSSAVPIAGHAAAGLAGDDVNLGHAC
jgi:hypothetical protein